MNNYHLNEQKMLKPKGKSGTKHFISATQYSAQGIKAAWKNEFAFRTELRLLIFFVPAAFLLGNTAVERSLLLLPLFFVLIAELTNTALETLCDRISTETHPLSAQAKDVGSAVVFTALLATICVWCLFIYEKFTFMLQG